MPPVSPTLSLGHRASWLVQGQIQGRIPAPKHLEKGLILAADRMASLLWEQPTYSSLASTFPSQETGTRSLESRSPRPPSIPRPPH